MMIPFSEENKTYFSQFNRGINKDHLCSANLFHRKMMIQDGYFGKLITYNQPPVTNFCSVDIHSLNYKQESMDQAIAQFNALDLKAEGVSIPPELLDQFQSQLIYDYLLKGSLCYIEQTKRTGVERFFATKNAAIIKAFSTLLAPTDKKKKLTNFQDQFKTSYQELETGVFKAVKLQPEVDGFHLAKQRINSKQQVSIIPRYSLVNYAQSLYKYYAGKEIISLIYTDDDGAKQKIRTSFNIHCIAKELDQTPLAVYNYLLGSWTSPLTIGQLSLPDLDKKQFCSVPLLNINDIKA